MVDVIKMDFLSSALGGSSALHIPAFPGGGCLIDYVPQVCRLLTNKVSQCSKMTSSFLSLLLIGIL